MFTPLHTALLDKSGENARTSNDEQWTLLLVDDSLTDRALITRAFRGRAATVADAITVKAVTNAEDAFAALREATFSLILLDYALPDQNGLDVLRQFREAGSRTPVVMITGAGDEHVAVKALQQGAADYVIKEIGFELTLPIVVERVLDKHTRELEAEHARLRADKHTRRLECELERQGRLLQRTVQESEILRRISQTLVEFSGVRSALDRLAQTAGERTEAQAAAVVIRRDAEFVLVSGWGAVALRPGLKSHEVPVLLDASMQAVMTVPLTDDSIEFGFLWAGRSHPRPFGEGARELLQTVAALAAAAIAAEARRRYQVPGETSRVT